MSVLIAYSSVAHMGFVTIGIFTLTEQAVFAMFQMIAAGCVGSIVLFVGVVYIVCTHAISAHMGVSPR